MTLHSYFPRCIFAGMILVPTLLLGCGGGSSGPQPDPTATTGPTATSAPTATPTVTATPEATIPGRANFNLTLGGSQTVTGQGPAQVGQSLHSLSVKRPLIFPGSSGTRTAITLNITSSRTLLRGDVIIVGNGASGTASRFGGRPTGGEIPFDYWKATSGQIRVESVSSRFVILRVQNMVFVPNSPFASVTFHCDGIIQIVR